MSMVEAECCGERMEEKMKHFPCNRVVQETTYVCDELHHLLLPPEHTHT